MQRGQATVEWLGVVALVALVIAVAAGLAGTATAGEAIAGGVVRGIQRALCVVRGGVCDLDRRPCVVRSGTTEDDAHISFGLIRIGRHEVILREHRSDGSVVVTYVGDWQPGAEGGAGADLWASAAGHEVAFGSSVRVAALATLGGADVYTFGSAREADVGMALLSEGRTPPGGPAQRVSHAGTTLSLDARHRRGTIRLSASILDGTLVDARTGNRTYVLSRDAALEGGLRALGASLSGGAQGGQRLSVTTDADGRPLELGIEATGELEGSLSLPDDLQAVAGVLQGAGVPASGHRRWVREQRLDLTDPENLAAAGDLLEALTAPDPLAPLVAHASARLRARLDAAGVTSARTYAVAGEHSGASLHVAAGARFGGALEDRREEATLLTALERGPDGLWHERSDCVA
jgi:hypothetical protein